MQFTILDNHPRRVISGAAMVLLAALPLIRVSALGDPHQAPRAVIASLSLAALGLTVAGRREPTRTLRWAYIAVAMMWIWLAIASIAGEPASSLWGVQGRFQAMFSFTVLVLAFTMGTVLPRARLPFLGMALSVASIPLSLIVIAQAVGGTIPAATMGNSTIAGSWLAVSVGFAAATAITAAGTKRAVAGAAAALAVVATAAGGSRAALVAAVVALVVLWLAQAKSRSTFRAAAALLVVVAVVVTGLLAGGPGVWGKYTSGSLTSGSAASRAEIWRSTSAMIADRPFLGVGPGRFLYEFPAYQTQAHAALENPDTRADQAHSQPLHYSAEGGVLAGLLCVAVGGLAILAAWPRVRAGDGAAFIALGASVAYLVQAMFGVASIETDVVGWLALGVAAASGSRSAEGTARPALRIALTGAGLLLSVMAAWYTTANLSYGRGLDTFAEGSFEESAGSLARAVATDPLTDVYRVAAADTASYRGGDAISEALDTLNAGITLEPRSFDLALARARLLELSEAPADETADAFLEALALYPHGTSVRIETAEALTAAGRTAEARLVLSRAVVDR